MKHLEQMSQLPVTMGATACISALETISAKRISVITPYQPIGDQRVENFFRESGYSISEIHGLKCQSPMLISHVSDKTLYEAVSKMDLENIDAIVQVGTNLCMARLAPIIENIYEIPVIAINTAIYWSALRETGIKDSIDGFGFLLRDK